MTFGKQAAVLLAALLWPALALAQGTLLPQLHDVTGVAADDVLNIRAEPSGSAPIIGALAPDLRGVEVVALNPAGTWGQVNMPESSGWVFMRYMAPRGVHIDHFNLPVGMRCFGTEPFWIMRHDRGRLRIDAPDTGPQVFEIDIAQDSGTGELRRMIRAHGSAGPLTAYIHPAACNDGMSDRAYGLAIGMMTGESGPLLTGCCSLEP